MLEFFRHRRIAKKLKLPWQEGRFLRFANTGDDDGGGLEEELATEEALLHGAEARENVSDVTQKYRGRLEQVGLPVAKATLDSPLVLESALDILENQATAGVEHSTELQDLIANARAYIRDQQEGTTKGPPRQELLKAIELQLNQPRLSMSIAEAFDRRSRRYDEEFKKLGETTPDEVVEIANEYKLSDTEDHKLVLGKLGDGEIDALVEKLKITVPTDFEVTENEDDNVDTKRTKGKMGQFFAELGLKNPFGTEEGGNRTLKEELITKKLEAAKDLAKMEMADFGTESTVGDITEVQSNLSKGAVHARRHVERTLRLRASELNDRWRDFRTKLTSEAGGGTTEHIAAYLQCSGTALEQEFNRIQATLQYAARAAEQSPDFPDADDINLPRISDEQFTEKAKGSLEKLETLDWLSGKDFEKQKQKFLGDSPTGTEDAAKWASLRSKKLNDLVSMDPDELEDIAELVLEENPDPDDVVEIMKSLEENAKSAQRIVDGKATPEDLNHLHEDLPLGRREWFDKLLLAASSVSFRRLIRRDRDLIAADSTENTEHERSATLNLLGDVEQRLLTHSALSHEVCEALGLQESLGRLVEKTKRDLDTAGQVEGAGVKGTQLLHESRNTVAKLEKTVDEFDAVMTDGDGARVVIYPPEQVQAYTAKAGTDKSVGCYNRDDGNIYINELALAQAAEKENIPIDTLRSQTIHHERGHAIYDILTSRVGAVPGLLMAMDQQMLQPLEGDAHGRTVEDLVWKRAEDWGVELLRDNYFAQEMERVKAQGLNRPEETNRKIAQRRTNDRLRERLMDELANKYASWKHQGETNDGFSNDDVDIFRILDKQPGALENVKFDKEEIADLKRPEEGALQNIRDGDADDPMDPTSEEGGGEDEEQEGALLSDRIINAQNDIFVLKKFIANHKNTDGVNEYEGWVNEWEQWFNENVRNPYYSGNDPSRPSDSEFAGLMDYMETDFLSDAKSKKDKVIKSEMEASGSQQQGGFMSMIRSLELASIKDVLGVLSSMGEDLQRMWKRRGERVQSILGKNLTSWIPDNNIWGVRYAGQLKHEFERRENASELEEVKQWKDAYENVDSFALMEQVGVSRNKDEVRAIVELLVERGRLDWNDKGFWKTLKDLSGLSMPMGACEGDSRVRDQWLQRMITAIWSNDKDKFFEWRQANDSGVKSGKDKFTQVADQLSNMQGGLAGALRQQLKMWTTAKKAGRPIPEEVNPHLYEELMHYAMRNGKMSMEQKLFYLIQGIRHGLLTVDRMQALQGQHGEILNSFPVIDYFMFRHNTLPEIQQLGARLDEDDDPFKPGAKTTLWLHLEVLRDEYAKMRMSKATSGTRAETLDHEDIPTVMAYADFRTVERLLDVVSGSREKMSPEAVKNAYTGFGTKFKVLAQLAELDMLTGTDIAEAAKGISAFIHYDNAITRNGKFKDTFTKMSWNEFRTTSPSSNGLSVNDFRGANINFIQALLNEPEISGEIDWNSMGANRSTILRTAEDTTQYGENDPGRGSMQKDMEVFSREIEKALLRHPQIIKKVLRQFRNQIFEGDYAAKGVPASKHWINQGITSEYINDRQNHGYNK